MTAPPSQTAQIQRAVGMVTTGRVKTLVSVTAILALAHWVARWAVLLWAPEMAQPHRVPFPWEGLLSLPVLVVTLTVFCLNRVILLGVACILGGAAGNLSELAVHGAVMDFISNPRTRGDLLSVGDVCLFIGVVLLAVGALVVVMPRQRAEHAATHRE
jgi:hypothetical protein